MSNARKRSELSFDEITRRLKNNNWTPVDSLEKVRERVVEFDEVQNAKVDSNFLWTHVFLRCPEIFLFNDLVAGLRKKYSDDSRRLPSVRRKDAVQMNNFEDAIDRMCGIAATLYQDILPSDPFERAALSFMQPTSTKKAKPKEAETEIVEERTNVPAANLFDDEPQIEQAKSPTKGKKLKLTKTVKRAFLDDKTPIEAFVPAEATEMLAALHKKKISTLGEFMAAMSQRDSYIIIQNNLRRNFTADYETFIDSICAYANQNHDEPPEQEHKPKKRAPDFYEQMSQRDAKDFEAGSETMAQIARERTEYMQQFLNPYIEEGFSAEDIENFMNADRERWHKIVDQKRAEAEKTKLRAYVAERLKKDEAYKINPKFFVDKENRHIDHFSGPFESEN